LKLTAFNLYNNSVKLKIKEDEISEENRKNLSNPTSSLRANVEEQHLVSTILKK
jgi:hypothetical protein